MAVGYGVDQPRTTYSDTNLAKRVIADAIQMITPTDTPFLSKFPPGSANTKFRVSAGGSGKGTKIEWIEDDIRATSGTMASTCTSDSTTITVSDGSYFAVGDLIKIDSEFIWVSAINQSTNTLTVTRNVGGTPTTHASNATIAIVSNARLEGATTTYGPTTSVDQPYNYTQILEDAVYVTRTQQKLAQYGVTDELARQRDKKLLELWRALEKALILEDVDLRSAGSSTTARFAGSLGAFITTAGNYSTTSTTITKANIDNLSKDIYLDGGNPRILMCHPQTAARIRDLLDSSSFVRVSQDESTLGMRVENVVTQYHELELLPNRHMDYDYAWLLDPDYIGVYEFDPFTEYDVPMAADVAGALRVNGEFSLVVQHGLKAHGKLYTTLSTGL